MNAFHFPQPGERLPNAAAVPVPEGVLHTLVVSIVNGTANSQCPGCEGCRPFEEAGTKAFWLLPPELQTRVVDVAEAMDVNVYEWYGMPDYQHGDVPTP